MYSLYLARRQDLVQALLLVNCDSLQLLQEPDTQHHAWVVAQLGLSNEQQQRIAAGFRVFKWVNSCSTALSVTLIVAAVKSAGSCICLWCMKIQ
jgi:hypothetical protein